MSWVNTICTMANLVATRPNNGCKQQEAANGEKQQQQPSFKMPLHYPRYKKIDYETMPEWRLDCLLKEYGLPVLGDVNHKRSFAMGAFLWPEEK